MTFKTTLIFLLGGLCVAIVAGCDGNRGDASTAAVSASPAEVADHATKRASNNTEHYSVRSPDEAIAAGRKQQVEWVIAPKGDLKINEEYPWKVEFSQPQGVKMAQTSFSKDQFDLGEKAATLGVFVEADQPGEHTLEATGSLSVCNDTKCYRIDDEPLSFKLQVAETDPADDGQ